MDWSDDESCALRVIGSELMVYRNNIYGIFVSFEGSHLIINVDFC